ncbi:MAG: DUF2817 domain-containing protein, partial [Acidimicrobiales bacterium]|nr:DUF2817 domain-containing protein [Acidimicrobiales bacterium]
DNIDLNRNWGRDRTDPRHNDAYDQLHPLACPDTDDPPSFEASWPTSRPCSPSTATPGPRPPSPAASTATPTASTTAAPPPPSPFASSSRSSPSA